MSKKLQEFFQTKKLVLALGLAGALAFTGGVYVSAQSPISTEPVVAETKPETDEQVTPTLETPEVTLVEQEVPTTEEPVETPVETPVVGDGAVSLAQAQVIAEAEHAGSAVKFSKTKQHEGATVFKFYFEDGWKVYVRESDGTVVRVIDASDHTHDCQNKYKQNREKADAVSAQSRWSDNDRRDGNRNWGGGDHRSDDSRRSR